jgi:hypothetical protein
MDRQDGSLSTRDLTGTAPEASAESVAESATPPVQDERLDREPAPSDATTSRGTETSTDASTAALGRGTTGPESATRDPGAAEPAASATPRTPETADRAASDVTDTRESKQQASKR